tara:strand:+ start:9857 stop:10159 length:303 start_codon:yes stop_codon:yes gene_type:complete
VLTAHQLNFNLTLIICGTNHKTEVKLGFSGSHNVIMPDLLGCNHMAALLTATDVNEFLDKLSLLSGGIVNLEELTLEPVVQPVILVSDFESKDSSLLSII